MAPAIGMEKTENATIHQTDKSHYGQLPLGWVLCDVGAISSVIQFGLSNSAESMGNYHLLRITDIQDNTVEWDSVPFTNISEELAKSYLLDVGDILFARTGATVGKSYLVSTLPVRSVFASYLIRVKLLDVDCQYVKFFFESLSYWEQIIDKSVGIGQPNVNGTKLKAIILPLPPLAEQHRIVAAIESAFMVIDEIEQSKADLQTAVAATKSKILSLAIRGKLVPQDPNDEPASALLECIRDEREKLVKAGKIKRQKGESAIFRSDDNSYYEQLPQGWVWACLGEIFNLQAGKFVQASDIANDNSTFEYPCYGGNGLRGYVNNYNREGNYPLIGRQGALCGNLNYVCGKFFATEHAVVVESFASTNQRWAFYFLSKMDLNQYSTATAQPGLSVKTLNEIHIPLPPIAEQNRMVVAIESTFAKLEIVTENLGS